MRTVRLKLVLTEEQKGSLLRTMEEYTRAFDHAARWGYRNKVCNKFEMHHETYRSLREDVPLLTAGLVQSASRDACDRLRQLNMKRVPERSLHAPIRFVWKEAKAFLESGRLSIASVHGRLHVSFANSDYVQSFSSWKAVSSLLVYEKRSQTFFLHINMQRPEVPKKGGEILGIDRGLRNVAVCSNNKFFSSSKVNAIRGKYAWNRATMQALGTRSAKRRLKKQSGRERRFVTCENHRISKEIVNTQFAVFALEDLTSISRQRWMDRDMKGKLRSWSYYQLESFIRYKAEEVGKTVIFVDPTCTSQQCSTCGWIDKRSRQGGHFQCVRCGFQLNADLNASRNIARLGIPEASRLQIYQPHAAGDEVDLSGVQAND
jgi:IS605 OrfB family transposase